MTTTLRLQYPLLRSWWPIPVATLVLLAMYYLLGYAFSPEAFEAEALTLADWVRLVVLDQFLIECVTTLILLRLLLLWARLWSAHQVRLTPGGVGRYLLAFLPVGLFSFFVFNPVTQTLRFLLRQPPDSSVYWDTYFFNVPLYFAYLALTLPMVYFVLVANLLMEYSRHAGPAQQPSPEAVPSYLTRLVGKRDGMEHPLTVAAIEWFEVAERIYYAQTPQGRYRVSHTMQELERLLDPAQFVRINRQVIVNLAAVEAFTPWFDGKYVVRMRGIKRTEFVVSRARVKPFRAQLEGTPSP